MFNLGKLTKLFYTFRNIPQATNASKGHILPSTACVSLLDINKQFFAGRPKQHKDFSKKEVVKSLAMSDEKSAKLSKAEEEAEMKRKKMEAERAKRKAAEGPEAPVKEQLTNFEAKITKKKLEVLVERMKKERLGLPEDAELEPKAKTKFRSERVIKEKKEKVEKEWPEKEVFTLNSYKKRERPSLRRKVKTQYGNTENRINRRHVRRLEATGVTDNTRRTGVIAQKIGMTALFDKWGVRHALTVLQVDRCQVIQVKTPETDGYYALQLGAGERNYKRVLKPEIGHYMRAGTPAKRILKEFHVSADNLLPVGFQLSARHFTPGQYVDVAGTSAGKGFQGTIVKFGFKMQPATHGNSRSHRMLGSTGQRQDPGRVYKNRKMPGRMGGDKTTAQSLLVYKIDAPRALIYIKGSIPGKAGSYCFIKDAWRKKLHNEDYLNCPTFLPKPGQKYAQEIVMSARETDPFEEYKHDNDIIDKD